MVCVIYEKEKCNNNCNYFDVNWICSNLNNISNKWSANVSENNEDFSVIFTAASIDGNDVYATAVDDTKKIITFETSELKKLNQTSILTYEITNNSSQYDAEVKSNMCTKKKDQQRNIQVSKIN